MLTTRLPQYGFFDDPAYMCGSLSKSPPPNVEFPLDFDKAELPAAKTLSGASSLDSQKISPSESPVPFFAKEAVAKSRHRRQSSLTSQLKQPFLDVPTHSRSHSHSSVDSSLPETVFPHWDIASPSRVSPRPLEREKEKSTQVRVHWFDKEQDKYIHVEVLLPERCTVRDCLSRVIVLLDHEYIHKDKKSPLISDPTAYDLRVAKKTGVPKADMPALEASQRVNVLGVTNFTIVPKKAFGARNFSVEESSGVMPFFARFSLWLQGCFCIHD
eukprot:GILI01004810.1.p1 GENE.GILI01004810.1~~GILI01004810.1.p1  ORF type:complete len:271 (-),score=51.12 GILI01004810.1:546-1358(-)